MKTDVTAADHPFSATISFPSLWSGGNSSAAKKQSLSSDASSWSKAIRCGTVNSFSEYPHRLRPHSVHLTQDLTPSPFRVNGGSVEPFEAVLSTGVMLASCCGLAHFTECLVVITFRSCWLGEWEMVKLGELFGWQNWWSTHGACRFPTLLH